MSTINFRKIIITSRFGPLLIFAVPFIISLLFVTGTHSPLSLVIIVVVGILFGLRMSSKFRENNDYFLENIKSDNYAVTKQYNKLFRRGQIPDSKDEQTAYLKYLDGLQKLNNRSVKGEYGGLTFLTVIFILSLFVDNGSLAPFFGPVIGLAIYGFVRSQKNLKKIEYFKKQMHLNAKAKV